MEKVKNIKESESKIQADCFQWLWNTYPRTRGLCYHVPNGGLRNPREAMKLKAMGTLSGVPDLVLAIGMDKINLFSDGTPSAILSTFHSLYVEMKTDKGRESPDQLKMHKTLRDAGNCVVIIRTLEEFKQLINIYIGGTYYVRKDI